MGKIWGAYIQEPYCDASAQAYFDVGFGPDCVRPYQAWLLGSSTAEVGWTNYKKPALDENAPPVPEGDFIVNKPGKYLAVLDPDAVLAWAQDYAVYGGMAAGEGEGIRFNVLEILTGNSSSAYRAMLRRLNIPYIIAGDTAIDTRTALFKLKTLFGIDTAILGGGGALNWSYISEGLCDELSLVLAPAADGAVSTPSVFYAVEGLSRETTVTFTFEKVEVLQGDTVHLLYKVNNALPLE